MNRTDDDTATVSTITPRDEDEGELLTPGQVARMFGVDPKTVARWADAGKIDAIRTLGGHRRYRPGDVEALLDAEPAGGADPRGHEADDTGDGDELRPAAAN